MGVGPWWCALRQRLQGTVASPTACLRGKEPGCSQGVSHSRSILPDTLVEVLGKPQAQGWEAVPA